MAKLPGKIVFKKRYLHADTFGSLSTKEMAVIHYAEGIANVKAGKNYNVARLEDRSPCVALLHYSDFFDAPFPSLQERWLVNTDNGEVSHRIYADSLNPPILHRKELLLPSGHPRIQEYSQLTESVEAIGLFDEPTRIGYRAQWNHLLKEKGYELVGHQLVPVGNDDSNDTEESEEGTTGVVMRHRTALVRYGFSAPIQALARHGWLDGSATVFDYGCGRGDDLRGLLENKVTASGWDPHFAPANPLYEADIVNLGFVVNVIEDFDERVEALSRAYSLARGLLVVSVMLANDNSGGGVSFNDGVLTKRSTFQKYYSQAEIKAFIQDVLDREAVPVGPGVFFIFRDEDAEQRFIANRYRSRRHLIRSHTSYRKESCLSRRSALAEERYQTHKEELETLWGQWLTLGRRPDPTEAPISDSLRETFRTFPKVLRFIESRKKPAELKEAYQERLADLSVYLALKQFDRSNPYKTLEPGLKRDIKVYFGSLKASQEASLALLFEAGQVERIEEACARAAERGLGHYTPGESLELHTSLVEQLDPVLRVYFGCAAILYGDYTNADLAKVHIVTGKLSLMRYDDFEGKPLPRMVERVKLRLRDQAAEYFCYDGDTFEQPYLYRKSQYINEEFPRYPEQLAFDDGISTLPFLDLSGFGPTPDVFHAALGAHRWEVDRFSLIRSQSIPPVDAMCGKYLTYRQLIECGETQAATQITNLPKNPDTYSALLDLASYILDPVIDYFGMIKLTYGFCSTELEKAISGRIAPKLDQHAAHEKRRNGHYVCKRLGAAVDFLVEDEDMEEVALWLAENSRFDRIYYYGKILPLHVSYGPEHTGSFVDMVETQNARLVPRVRKLALH